MDTIPLLITKCYNVLCAAFTGSHGANRPLGTRTFSCKCFPSANGPTELENARELALST